MLGPSGTGKSVFLKCLVGLLKPDEGRVVVEGVDLCRRELAVQFVAAAAGGGRVGDLVDEQADRVPHAGYLAAAAGLDPAAA